MSSHNGPPAKRQLYPFPTTNDNGITSTGVHVAAPRPHALLSSEVAAHPSKALQDDIQPCQDDLDLSPNAVPRKVKRARTEVTRSSMSYPRKRAVRACQLCRTRKTKCNNIRPICGACNQIDATCIYEDSSDHSSFDPASLMMLDRLNQIIDILHTSAVPGALLPQQSSEAFNTSHHGQDESIWDKVSSISAGFQRAQESQMKDNEYTPAINQHISSQNATISVGDHSSTDYLCIPPCATSTSGILQWPVFEAEFPLNCLNTTFVPSYDEQAEHSEISSVRSSAAGFGIQEEEIEGLVEDFLTFVHIKNPILHPDTLRSYARKVAENGPQWDSKSCLVYLTCALGCLAQAFELKDFSPLDPSTTQKRNSASHDNHKLRRAAAYYNIARKRIGLLVPSLITAHCVFFSGVYLMYNMQPLQAWYNFYQAATLTHMCLKSSASTDEKTIRLEQCLYWSCFKSECEMGGELSLAVSALGTLEYPHLFPTPPSVPSLATDRTSPHADTVSDSCSPAVSTPYSRRTDSLITYNEDQSWYYYLTEIALRRIGNRVLNTFYKDGFMSWLNLSPQAISGMINIAKQFDDEILQRIDGLPDSLRSDHADMSASSPGELAHVVRARVIEIQNWLCRPFLFYAIHNPAHDILQEAIRPFVDRALRYAVRVIVSVAHRHRHHGTWYALRSGTTACCLIIAAVRCGHITPPIEWESLICRHISTLKYWESEAADLANARLILERLLNNSRTDLS